MQHLKEFHHEQDNTHISLQVNNIHCGLIKSVFIDKITAPYFSGEHLIDSKVMGYFGRTRIEKDFEEDIFINKQPLNVVIEHFKNGNNIKVVTEINQIQLFKQGYRYFKDKYIIVDSMNFEGKQIKQITENNIKKE